MCIITLFIFLKLAFVVTQTKNQLWMQICLIFGNICRGFRFFFGHILH